MRIAADIGRADLAIGGTAAALARLMEPAEGEAREALTAHLVQVLRQTSSRELDERRLAMTVRLAEMQALVLTLRTFRAAEAVRRDVEGHDGGDADLDWLLNAERSLEVFVQGETFMATNPPGLSPSWMDVVASDAPAREGMRFADYRRRAEAVAIGDLELALTPVPVSTRLLHRMACGTCAPATGWFDAFAMFLGWQLDTKPHLIQPMLGVDLARLDRETRLRLTTAFDTARRISLAFEQALAATDVAPRNPAACDAMAMEPSGDDTVRAVASALRAPESPLADIARRLAQSKLPPARLGRALRQHAVLLAAVHARWRRPDWAALAPAHEALCAGRVADAAQWAHAHIADSASGLSERADLEMLAGQYLKAAELCGRALEAIGADATGDRLWLQLRLAEALTFEYLTTASAETKQVAIVAAEAARQSAVAAGSVAARLRAASMAAELSLAPKGPERGSTLVAAIAMLDAAIGDAAAEPSLDRIEAEALRVELLVELGEIDKEGRQRHQDALAKAAKALSALDLSALPAWIRDMASGVVGRGLLGAPDAPVDDRRLRQAQSAFEAALGGDLAAIDPHRAGVLLRRLGEVHQKLAKGSETRARREAAALSHTRASRLTVVFEDRVRVLQLLREALEQLAKGGVAEWRLCQGLAVLNIAESACVADKPTVELAGVFRQRAILWTKLRALSKSAEDFRSAVTDAEAAYDVARKLKSPWWTQQTLRAKANALLEMGTDLGDVNLLAEGEATLAKVITDRKALKVPDRDLCYIWVLSADAANLRSTLLPDAAARTAALVAARDAYREALRLATAHNLSPKGKCEAALKKIEAEAA